MTQNPRTLEDLLTGFPTDWDINLFVCCRGETGHGPLGVRRWTATTIFRTPTHEEIMGRRLPPKVRLQTSCCGDPSEAVRESMTRIAAWEVDRRPDVFPGDEGL